MGTEPWKGEQEIQEGENVAATHVSWFDATEFCRRLTERERAIGKLREGWEYRLPTEAEREWACRAGTPTAYSFGNDVPQLGAYAWWVGNAEDAGEAYPHEVGLKEPNPWGLYDVHGNVWEWCRDWRGDTLAGGTDPVGPDEGRFRVIRGGSWSASSRYCRSASRSRNLPSDRYDHLGFRLVLSPSGQ